MEVGRESVVERVRRINGVSYEWQPGMEGLGKRGDGARELGVIAQEVERSFPEAVVTGADGLKKVDYLGLVAVLVEAVKELDERVRRLEAR
ncbi:MAG: tail fiber domain-containing protein [Actinomycetota bacterium]|nr:tail fiber domain-containing protein [Actinomycetota bacterium]MDQ3648514.1 tail fiber domain-containing protein [Actinomycetota bacterium]